MTPRTVEATGRSVEEAILQGLSELALERDSVDIQVLEEGSRGVLGLFGSKPARVLITEILREQPPESPQDEARFFVQGVIDRVGLDAQAESSVDEDGTVRIDIVGDAMGTLIGHRGETLDALQYLTSLIVNRGKDEYLRVVLDTENYRARREEALQKLARRLAGQVRRTRTHIALEPMNPYERRVLHSALQGYSDITTYSEGDEPNRRVVIALQRQERDYRPAYRREGAARHR